MATGTDGNVLQVAKLHHVNAFLLDEKLAGVVVDSHTDRSAYITAMLAQREGAILPVITAEYNDNLIQRLVTEKTISIDTTASGGNTSLMTLVDDD
jgi:RHH-type proline utilization regulon transcriptional repressor/proline dehydrogenase/delta 1-pyrroline-5-carboxylate dehydrogenase